ncbi:hypothetical protein FQN54_003165 [Arachnomyces sp. PD_36]|nr:hypothetical protein FQN54_003165 [Arachnomyces sp. PD_36]
MSERRTRSKGPATEPTFDHPPDTAYKLQKHQPIPGGFEEEESYYEDSPGTFPTPEETPEPMANPTGESSEEAYTTEQRFQLETRKLELQIAQLYNAHGKAPPTTSQVGASTMANKLADLKKDARALSSVSGIASEALNSDINSNPPFSIRERQIHYSCSSSLTLR